MVSLRLEESLEKELNTLCQKKELSKSKIIKNALIYYFDMLKKEDKKSSAYELGADLFGKYSSEKGDLSTTYKQKLKQKLKAKNGS